MLVHDVVLALALGEVHPRHAVVAGEAVHRGVEGLAALRQRRGRGDRQAQLLVDEPDQPGLVLQPGHVGVEIHPVDALHLEQHMLIEDIGDAAGYRHHWLRSDGRPARPTNRSGRFIHRTGSPVTV